MEYEIINNVLIYANISVLGKYWKYYYLSHFKKMYHCDKNFAIFVFACFLNERFVRPMIYLMY